MNNAALFVRQMNGRIKGPRTGIACNPTSEKSRVSRRFAFSVARGLFLLPDPEEGKGRRRCGEFLSDNQGSDEVNQGPQGEPGFQGTEAWLVKRERRNVAC